MKKIIALSVAILMMMSMAGCNGNEGSTNENTTTTTAETTTTAKEDATAEANTVGEKLLADFKADSKGTAQEIADRLLTNEVIEFAGGATVVEEGLLSGFDNAEIKGFKEGVMFAPMMSSIAFVGYIFELPADADVEAFKTTLKDSANLRWNICVEAEELIVESEGNKVFFLMCPKSFEQSQAEGDNSLVGDMEEPADDMIPAEDGITLE
ncbi:MAG: hypothetical protein U0L20_01055 [Ruminococcus sp.]|nr:hypothetical protein [Ruminococcus sp.]